MNPGDKVVFEHNNIMYTGTLKERVADDYIVYPDENQGFFGREMRASNCKARDVGLEALRSGSGDKCKALAEDTVSYVDPKGEAGAKKPSIHLVPPSAIIAMARCMENGASKYGPYNWRQGHKVNVTTYISANFRHGLQFLDGEDNASDSGLSHVAHMMSGLAVLYDAIQQGVAFDDRPKKGTASKLIEGDI